MHQNPCVMSKSNALRKNSVLTKISKKKKEKCSYLEEEIRKRNKRSSNWKGRGEIVPICRWHVIKYYYIENPKDTAIILSEIRSKSTKFQGTQLIYWNLCCFYTLIKTIREIKKTASSTTAPKRMRVLGIHLTKEIKDFFSDNSYTVMKEMSDSTNRWKNMLCSWTERINKVKMP